jgi:hypothetical protein
LGEALARRPPQPFAAPWDLMLTYDRLDYMHWGRIDEFQWLAEQIAQGLEAQEREAEVAGEVRRLLEAGRSLEVQGDVEGYAKRVMEAYQIGRAGW